MTQNQLIDLIRPGDIIFIRVANFLYRRVSIATDCWTTHVGVIHSHQNGEWQVAESTFPFAKLGPLSAFIKRSENSQFAIRRLPRTLSDEEVGRIRVAAERRMGRWYDARFDFDQGGLYCSKLVYEVFQEALGIPIGEVETFEQLLNRNPHAPQSFWRWWFLGRIPWQQRTVTPASQWRAEDLLTVGSFGR